MLVPVLAALLAAPASAGRLERLLDKGLWNQRITALYEAGERGRSGLPLLEYAATDADWQVRLTAVHFMGKLGAPAASALGDLVRDEPCPYVRLSALRWLARMGTDGRGVYDSVLTPEDAAELAREPDRYGTERMGKPLAIDAPGGEMTPEFFAGGTDLRVCASSEHSGHRGAFAAAPALDEDLSRGSDDPSVVTAPVPPRPAPASAPEKPAGPAPETLPPGPPAPERAPSPGAEGRYEAPDARLLARGTLLPRDGRPGESLPPGPAAPERAAAPRGEAAFVEDAGTGRPEDDPVPRLIELLSAPDARRRARVADELGKRGEAARPALPALRRALKDRDRRVRASAALALGSVGAGSKEALADVRRALRDKDEDVRFSAALALERLRAAARR